MHPGQNQQARTSAPNWPPTPYGNDRRLPNTGIDSSYDGRWATAAPSAALGGTQSAGSPQPLKQTKKGKKKKTSIIAVLTLVVGLSAAVGTIGVWLWPRPESPVTETATIKANPAVVSSGGSIRLTGSGFEAGESVRLTWSEKDSAAEAAPSGDVMADGSGKISQEMTVGRSGAYVVTARGQQSGHFGSVTVTVTAEGPATLVNSAGGPWNAQLGDIALVAESVELYSDRQVIVHFAVTNNGSSEIPLPLADFRAIDNTSHQYGANQAVQNSGRTSWPGSVPPGQTVRGTVGLDAKIAAGATSMTVGFSNLPTDEGFRDILIQDVVVPSG